MNQDQIDALILDCENKRLAYEKERWRQDVREAEINESVKLAITYSSYNVAALFGFMLK